MASHANDDDLTNTAEKDQRELRSLLEQTQFLLRRAQQVIERTRDRRSKE